MARVPWLYMTLFFLVPLLLIVADVAYLSKEVWTVPWLALIGIMWFGIGIVVGVGALEMEPART